MTLDPCPSEPRAGESRTAIYVYGRTTLALECAVPLRLSVFSGCAPAVHFDAGSHAIAVEPGVYLVHAGPGLAIDAGAPGDLDVVPFLGDKPARRTPRRLFKVLPSIDRRALARFLRQPAPAPPPPPRREIRRILVIDEDEAAARRYARGFGPARTVLATPEPAIARKLARSAPCDLAIVELRIGDQSGIELALELKREQPELVVALCSGYLSVEIAIAAVRAGIDIVLFKPVTAREILHRIDGADADADAAEPEPEPEPDTATATLEHAEREHIERVLADCDGNISKAAHRLGIYRSSLQRRLRKVTPPGGSPAGG